MKLLPILAGTLLKEARAQSCNPNLPIFKVTCHEDLIVELEGIKIFHHFHSKFLPGIYLTDDFI